MVIESLLSGGVVVPDVVGGVMPDEPGLALLSAGAMLPEGDVLPEGAVLPASGVVGVAGGVGVGVAGVDGVDCEGMVGAGGGVEGGSDIGSAERRLQPENSATSAPATSTVLIVLFEKGIELFIGNPFHRKVVVSNPATGLPLPDNSLPTRRNHASSISTRVRARTPEIRPARPFTVKITCKNYHIPGCSFPSIRFRCLSESGTSRKRPHTPGYGAEIPAAKYRRSGSPVFSIVSRPRRWC